MTLAAPATSTLAATLKGLPAKPGVYVMKDARGEVIYVGKAQSLRNRVRSYWQAQSPGSGAETQIIRSVIDRVADVEYSLTDNVSEALLLEAALIKRYRPRFNIRLKDDKSYPYIKVTLADDFPRIERTRRLPADGSRYFGPYASASSVDDAMNLIRRLFPFRTCTLDIKDGQRALQRPCLLYHIKRCQAPCIQAIDKPAYRADIEQVELFLEGRQDAVLRGIRKDMESASERMEYERAAALRDKVRAIERTMESQKMAAFARTEEDILGLARQDNQAAVQLFAVRNGRTVGRDVFLLDAPREATDEEVLAGFVQQFYARATAVPPSILVPLDLPDAADLETFLTSRRAAMATADGDGRIRATAVGGPLEADVQRDPGWVIRDDAVTAARASRRHGPVGRVHLHVPQRGDKRQLVALATQNARETLAKEQARWLADHGKTLGALEELADALGLPSVPMRIECYDISTFQGAQTVGSMVVFEEGRPRTGEYRRFRVKSVQGPNDFASHQEVLRRRFHRARTGEEGSEEELRWRMPDLVIIDGGKGQLSAAKEVLDDLGLHDLPVAGLAKEREELFLPERADPVLLPATSSALYLVQRLRDEAHRFAITYHRALRSKASMKSGFDELPGVGPRRKQALLRVFGSLKRVREAPVEQIAAVPGIGPALAARIKQSLGDA